MLTVNYTYDIPSVAKVLHFNNPVGTAIFGGWRMGHLFTYVSGQWPPLRWAASSRPAPRPMWRRPASCSWGRRISTPRLALTGDPNALNRDFAHYFDASKFALPGFYPGLRGKGDRNYIRRPDSFANDMTLTKAFKIKENHAFELRAAFYNAFNQVRRRRSIRRCSTRPTARLSPTGSRCSIRRKLLAARNSTLTGTALYNQYRTGVGHTNLTDVNVMRVIEIGLKYRF